MVEQAVRAALDQSLAPAEIIVADDASTDHTGEVLERLAAGDPRVRVIRQQSNTGGIYNANRAMEAARGELIAWCSDDDRFLPGHLEASAAYLAAHPEVGLVHSGFVDCWETADGHGMEPRPLRSSRPLITHGKNMFRYLMRYYDWPFHPSTLVIRRAVWEQVGAFDSRYLLTDTDWFVRALSQFPAALLPRYGVVNRRHAGNWSNRVGSARMQCEIFEIVDRAMLKRWPRSPATRMAWRTLWSANVRLRLALTIRARLAAAHTPGALAAWEALAGYTGYPLPGWLAGGGRWAIENWPAPATPVRQAPRTSVSPP